MTGKNRVPRGVSQGGQFAASAKGEAGVSLGRGGHVWSEDPDLVKPPKAAVTLVTDAEAAGMTVDVEHTARGVAVNLASGRDTLSVVWSKGEFYDEPDRGKLPFRTSGTPTQGVRFDYATGYIRGEYPVLRSARQARAWIGLEA